MKIEVNLEKKYFFSFLIVGLIIIGISGVLAFNTNSPNTFGHSTGEVDWNGNIPKICLNGVCITSWPVGNGSTSVTYINSTSSSSGISDIIAGNGITTTKYPNGTVSVSASGTTSTVVTDTIATNDQSFILNSLYAIIRPSNSINMKSALIELNNSISGASIKLNSTYISFSGANIMLGGKKLYQVNAGCNNAGFLTFNSTCITAVRSGSGPTTYYQSCTGTGPYYTYPSTCQNPLV